MLGFQMVRHLALSRVVYSVCKRTERPPGTEAVPEIIWLFAIDTLFFKAGFLSVALAVLKL